MNKQRKTSHILNVFQYDHATGIIGLNGAPVSGYGLYLTTNINDGSVGIDSSASINALYLLKNTTKQFEISYDTSGATKIFRLLPYQSGSFFQIGNPSNAANSNSDYVFISEATYGNVLIGPGIGNGTGNLTGATASIHKVQFNGAVFANNSIQATSFKITGGASTGFLKADGTVDAVTYLSGNQSITVSGDATGSGTTSIALTLANTAVTPGVYGSTTLVPVVTVDSKGRITSVTTAAISGSLTFTGDVTGSGTTGTSTGLTLAASGVTAGTYTKVTVDSKGRVTVGASATTSDISEGTNLYYTDARVLSYLSANTYATQSYVNTQVSNLVAAAPATLDTLNELAAALGNDPSFATTISTALGNRLRVDINNQGLSGTLQGYGRTNLGLGTAATSNTGDFVAYRTFGTAANSAIGDFVAYRTFGTAANNNTGDFALASHTHSIADVTGLQTALDGKQASGSYAASSHSHIISDVTGLQTALDGKQASLGFTPYNATNPSGYISSITSGNVTTALGFTPYNATNPSGYISSYTETSTLANVTARGASTSTRTTFTEVGASRAGSDTIGDGPWFRWTNVAESRQMLTQLNASFGLTTWAYNGSAWVSAMTLTQAGALSLTSTISASNFSGTSSGTNTGDQTLSGLGGVPTSGYAFGTAFTLGTMYVGTGEQFTPTTLLGVYSNGYAYKFPVAGVQSWLGLGSLAYSSATIPTNNNQLTNGAGYITSYSETDTLASVTGRGATTTSPITINGGGTQPLSLTTTSGSPWHIALNRTDLGLTSRVFAHNSPYNGWYFEHNISIAGNTNWHSGNLTNLNQLSNGPGYITSSGSISGNAATATSAGTVTGSSTISGYLTLSTNWGVSPYTSAFTIIGTHPSMTFRGSNGDTHYLMHMDSAGDIQYYFGPGYTTNNWTQRYTFTKGGNFSALTGNISASGTVTGSNLSGTNTGDQTNITGNAGSVTGLTLTSSANSLNPDNVTQNQLGYNTSVSLFGQTDGGLYSSAYSSSWIHQIFGDFRTGQIAIRGKNSGTWQAWRVVLDSSNFSSYALPLSGGTIATNGFIDFGPNSTWGSTLRVGGNGHGGTTRASVCTTNGNLHLDGGTTGGGGGIYLNAYHNGPIYATTSQHLVLHAGNYNSYSPTLTGGGASGTWGINISGNAATATTATNALGLANSGAVGSLSSAGQVSGWDSRPGGNAAYSIGYHTGLSLHGYGGYGGVRLYSAGYPTLSNSVLRLEASDSVKTYGILYNDTSVRAPIYYDSDDTAYYLNPAGGSRLRNLYVGDSGDDWSDPGGWGTQVRFSNAPHVKFVLHARTPGIEAGMYVHTPSSVYIGSYTSHDVSMMYAGNRKMQITNSYIYTDVYLEAAGSLRAPIFYDSNDTGYYLDPNDTSNLSRLIVNNAVSGAALLIGSTNTSRVINDNARKALVINAEYYPGLHLNAYAGNNTTHGAYIVMSGNLSAGGYRLWTMGIANSNPGMFSIGYSDQQDGNGHYGVGDGWSGNDAHHGRLIVDTSGNTKIRGMLYVNGTSGGMTTGNAVYHTGNMDAPNKSGTSYYQVNTWLQMNGTHGMYWPSYNGAHIYANTTGSYTQLRFDGVRGGYTGVYLGDSAVNGMMYDTAGNGGVYREANGLWYFYYHIGNNCMGVGTSTTSSSYKMYVNGTVYATGDVIAYSDARKKTNIVTIDKALETVTKMRGVFYDKIGEESNGRQLGVIAQEVNKVLPEAVNYASDIDEYGVKYGNIVGVLIEAIKEQQLQIEELKNKLDNVLSSR